MKNRGEKPISVGLVGYGYWGKNLLRNLELHPGVEVRGVTDQSRAARARCQSIHPHLKTFESLNSLLREENPSAIAIATSPESHADLAIEAIRHGCDVLIEKPMALSTTDCDRILSEAEKLDRKVLVDHTYVYNPSISYIANEHFNDRLGNLLSYDSVRVNFGGFQTGANVLWDLAPHDFSILDLLTRGALPQKIHAIGVKHFSSHVENLCYVTLEYADGMLAHLHLSWSAPIKIRQVILGASQQMVVYDDNLPAEKVKLYNHGIGVSDPNSEEFKVNYRKGEMRAPSIPSKEPLSLVINDFVYSIRNRSTPISDGRLGRRIVRLLEESTKSMKRGATTLLVDETSPYNPSIPR